MDITWFGQSCFRIKGKNATVVTDPFHHDYVGLKKIKASADIVTVSHAHEDHNASDIIEESPFIIYGPGEYEIKGVSVHGVQTFHDAKEGKERGPNTLFTIEVDGVTICHAGDLGHELTAEQLEQLIAIDILLIPVGGVYTIDANGAQKVINQLEPKVVIPMHYALPDLKFKLNSLEDFLHVYGKGKSEAVGKYSITKDKLPDNEELVILAY